jgi:putative ABC transport system ATP-binding protein
MSIPSLIALESVSKAYPTPGGTVHAVSGVTLGVEPGTSMAITGPSGCGKSTLLGMIAGLEPPTSGQISIGGVEMSQLSDHERAAVRRDRLGLIFQADNLLPFLTALENVALQFEMGGSDGRPERCTEILADLGLRDHAHKLPDQLSGGQRQRVAIAAALMKQPAVILADEPTGSLDADASKAVIDLLVDAQRQAGATLVIVTHDTSVADRLDHTVRLRDGRVVERERVDA